MDPIGAWMVAAALVQAPTAASPESAATNELSRLEELWNDAHLRGDVEALDRLWAEDSVIVVPGMAAMTKAAAIGVMRSGRMKFQRYQTTEVRIRVYDNAAVVTGRLQRTRSVSGRIFDDDWQFTKVCVRRAGQWQVVAFHASPFTP